MQHGQNRNSPGYGVPFKVKQEVRTEGPRYGVPLTMQQEVRTESPSYGGRGVKGQWPRSQSPSTGGLGGSGKWKTETRSWSYGAIYWRIRIAVPGWVAKTGHKTLNISISNISKFIDYMHRIKYNNIERF